jgi:hypothetical protein
MKKNKEQGLQKLTVSDILKLKVITNEDIDRLSTDERKELGIEFNKLLNEKKGVSRDAIFKKYWGIMNEDSRNSAWENNHNLITNKLHFTIKENGYIPGVTELSNLTGISRQTITKHLNSYKQSSIYSSFKESFLSLNSNVMQAVYQMAMKGDIKACKLYFELVGELNKTNNATYIDKQQNNHTQNNFSPIEVKIIPPLKE